MTSVPDILAKAVDGGRLTPAEGLALFEHADLVELGVAAHAVRTRLHPENVVSYIIDRNVNYSNICDSYCKFCSFFAAPGAKDGYLLSKATLTRKIRGTEVQQAITELAMQAVGPMAQPFKAMDNGAIDHFTSRLAPRYFNLRKASIYAGSNEIQRNIIAKMTLGL